MSDEYMSPVYAVKAVPVENRFMDIVVVNQDNTISTLYEFTYS